MGMLYLFIYHVIYKEDRNPEGFLHGIVRLVYVGSIRVLTEFRILLRMKYLAPLHNARRFNRILLKPQKSPSPRKPPAPEPRKICTNQGPTKTGFSTRAEYE